MPTKFVISLTLVIMSGCVSNNQDNPYTQEIALMERAMVDGAPGSAYTHAPIGAIKADNAIPSQQWIDTVSYAAEGKVLCFTLKKEIREGAWVTVWGLNSEGVFMGLFHNLSATVVDLSTPPIGGKPVMFKIMVSRPGAIDRLEAYQKNLVSRENILVRGNYLEPESLVRQYSNSKEIMAKLPENRFAPERLLTK